MYDNGYNCLLDYRKYVRMHSKENGNSQSNQKEQTIQINQTEEEISENEDVKNEEELQPTTVTVVMWKRFNQSKGVQLF